MGTALLSAAGAMVGGSVLAFKRINHIASFLPDELEGVRRGRLPALFHAYPGLTNRIPWRPLAEVPTPVERLAPFPGTIEGRHFVKRDDLASPRYGGNKVRKLEFLLAEAELAGARTLITLGGSGSNHALATALHGADAGFEVDLVLYDQPVTPYVRRNLGGFLGAGARLHHGRSIPRSFLLAGQLVARRKIEGKAPYFIMVGGSSRLGCIGHVSAGLELARQIADGELPEPDRLFVPLGTCGTAAGLIVGLKLANLRTRVCAVQVADPFPANAPVLRWIAQDVADFLHDADPAVPRVRIKGGDFDVLTDYFGPGYGFPTAAGEEALRWAAPRLDLETTYSAKTLAACLSFGAADPGSTFLFWDTYNSAPVASPAEWTGLPTSLAMLAEESPG